MKVLVVSRGGLEISRAMLEQRITTIGRSPSCDVVLRAPGVSPVHFLMEWLGSDEFDPSKGNWTVFDVSNVEEKMTEGVLLTDKKIEFEGFQLQIVDDKLANRGDIGGVIQKSLNTTQEGIFSGGVKLFDILEIVQTDNQAVEEIFHLPFADIDKNKVRLPKELAGELKMDRRGISPVPMFIPAGTGITFYRMGRKLSSITSLLIGKFELVEARAGGKRFFIRLSQQTTIPPIQRKFFQETLLLQTTTIGFLLGFIVLVYAKFNAKTVEDIPARVATIQIKEPPKPKEAPPPPPAPKVAETPKLAPKTEPVPKKAMAPKAAPKVAPKPIAPPAPVVEKPKPSLVNILNANAPTVTKVDDKMIQTAPTEKLAKSNSGVAVQAVTSDQVNTNQPANTKAVDLSKIAGAVSSDGIVAKPNSKAGNGPSSNFGALSTGLATGDAGMSGSSLGKIDGNGFEISGGLDRETVRRVIRSSMSAYRVCWERSLLTNPSLSVRLVYKWMISPEGNVVTIGLKESDGKAPSLEACLQDELRKLVYPKAPNGSPTNVIYPFEFKPKN